jgi:ornithine decarboxylase
MDITPDFIKKKTWNKVLNYIASSDEAPPYLLIDKEVVKEKVSTIGRNIRNSRVFYAVKANPDTEVLRFLGRTSLDT